jgi:hypothetical protein
MNRFLRLKCCRERDPIQLAWMVNQFCKRDTQRPRPAITVIPRLPPSAAGGGLRGLFLGRSLLAYKTDSPTAQGGWGLEEGCP